MSSLILKKYNFTEFFDSLPSLLATVHGLSDDEDSVEDLSYVLCLFRSSPNLEKLKHQAIPLFAVLYAYNYLFTRSCDGTLKRWALAEDVAAYSATFELLVDWVVGVWYPISGSKIMKLRGH
ncbi:Hypothetical predicted protein [Olea europaea subsp. europaea]|uniref:Uncharacterized protein n=1 Tax=Olea europaea subsp. europaea TaxID=158383 RepID=A0A8S0P646_OLEEU|nr:Hypothetical predicted protein [Olea europaea subsp. europaea]